MNRATCKLSVDRAIKLLGSTRRRRLVQYLTEEDEAAVEREELARFLHAERLGERRDLRIVLAHQDLPRLADGGLIEYDQRSGAVRPTQTLEKLRPLLDACAEIEASWD